MITIEKIKQFAELSVEVEKAIEAAWPKVAEWEALKNNRDIVGAYVDSFEDINGEVEVKWKNRSDCGYVQIPYSVLIDPSSLDAKIEAAKAERAQRAAAVIKANKEARTALLRRRLKEVTAELKELEGE